MISSKHKKNESNPDLILKENIGALQIKNESIVKFKNEIVDIVSQYSMPRRRGNSVPRRRRNGGLLATIGEDLLRKFLK